MTRLAYLPIVSMLALAASAFAQESGSPASAEGGLQEITVTAQRRSEPLQNVPIAVTALDMKDIQDKGLNGPLDLAGIVPNLTIMKSGPSILNPFIRGVGEIAGGPNDEPSVATYVDGVYIASPSAAATLSFNNIERIEVLKGPQGTLFGRNATGGVIQIVTRDPSHTPEFDGSIEYANYDEKKINAYLTAGLNPWIATDFAAFYDDQSRGYGHDFTTGSPTFIHKDYALRSKTLMTPNDATEIRLTADYSRTWASSPFQLAQGVVGIDGVTTYPGRYNTDNDVDMINRVNQYGASIRLDEDLGAVRLASISSYRHNDVFFTFDQDMTPVPLVPVYLTEFQENVSQELQLLSSPQSPVDWLVGAFYYNSKAGEDPVTIKGLAAAPLPFENIIATQHTVSESIYGQASVELLPRLKGTLGLRGTNETQSVDGEFASVGGILAGPFHQSSKFDKLTWRLALDYQFSQDVHGYVSDNRGVKSGGYNLFTPQGPGYRPETLDAYEVGLKTEMFDRHVRLNVAAFYYDYRDIQVSTTVAGAVTTQNAAKAQMYGMDADLQVVATDRLTFSGGLGLLNARYQDFPNAVTYGAQPGPIVVVANARGNATPLAVPVTASLTASYKIPVSTGNVLLSATEIYNDSSFKDTANRLRYPSYALLNGSIAWAPADEHLGVRVWIKNATNATYYVDRYETSFGDIQQQAPPRTYGVTVSTKFK
jgi:iron complex outermembrane recepter protein